MEAAEPDGREIGVSGSRVVTISFTSKRLERVTRVVSPTCLTVSTFATISGTLRIEIRTLLQTGSRATRLSEPERDREDDQRDPCPGADVGLEGSPCAIQAPAATPVGTVEPVE